MKVCPYCGKQYPDDREVCALDEQPLKWMAEAQADVTPPKNTCPQCGAADDFTRLAEARGSFSVPVFLLGGLFAVLFRNAGRARRVKCNQCHARFHISSPLSKFSRVIFWLLIAPAIIVLGLVLIAVVRCLLGY